MAQPETTQSPWEEAATAALDRRAREMGRTERCEEWLQGFACALGSVVRTFDQPTLCKSIMDGYGVTVKMLKEAGVESYDLKQIRSACK